MAYRFQYQSFVEPLWRSGDEPLDWLPNDQQPTRPVEDRSYLFSGASVEPLLPLTAEPVAPSVPLTRGEMAFRRAAGEWIVVGTGGGAVLTVGGASTTKG